MVDETRMVCRDSNVVRPFGRQYNVRAGCSRLGARDGKAGWGEKKQRAARTDLSGCWPSEAPVRPWAEIGSSVGAVGRLIRHNDRGRGRFRFLAVNGLVNLLAVDGNFLRSDNAQADLVAANLDHRHD